MKYSLTVRGFLLGSLATLIVGTAIEAPSPPQEVHLGAVFVGCGGIINVTQGDTFYVVYKFENETISDNESCMWTFLDATEYSNSNLLVQFELMYHGFLHNEQLAVSTFNGYNSLATTVIRPKELYDFLGSGIFLTFQSTLGGGTGFMVKIETSLFRGHNRVTRVFDTLPGSTSYGPYTELDRVVVVVNPNPVASKKPYTLWVDSINTEFSSDCSNDGMEIYELQPLSLSTRGNWDVNELWKLKYRLCSNGAVRAPVGIKTELPLITLFWTDLTESGGDFSLSWELQ